MEQIPYQQKITYPVFRKAVSLIDTGEVEKLRDWLFLHNELIHQRIRFDEEGYFSNPGLLEFIAENPVRSGKLPDNIVDVARVILDAGAKTDKVQINYTLGLVSSGRVARECHVQIPLINILCQYDADPDAGILPALTHGEFEAVSALIENGARENIAVAAATGDVEKFDMLLPIAVTRDKHLAFAYAAQFGQAKVVKRFIANGEDLNRFNPEGTHEHSTALHQAVIYNHPEVVQMLVEAGARMDLKDRIFNGTPLDWAIHANLSDIEKYLRSKT